MTPSKTDLLKPPKGKRLPGLCIAAALAGAAVPASMPASAQSQRSEDSAVLRKSAEPGAAFNVQQSPQSAIVPFKETPAAKTGAPAASGAPTTSIQATVLAERERERQRRDALITRLLADSADATDATNVTALLTFETKYPDEFGCAHIDRLWRAAEIFAKAGHIDAAGNLYRAAIPACTPARNRIATIYKAQQNLPAAQVDDLIEREAKDGRRDTQSDVQFARLRYDRSLSVLALLAPASDQAADQASRLTPEIRGYRDAAGATMVGYILLAQRHTDEAGAWFDRAHSYAPNAVDPQLGRVQILLERDQLDAAEALLSQSDIAADRRAGGLRAQLAVRRAVALNLDHQYENSLAQLDLAQQLGTPAAELAQLRGWDLYGLGQYQASQTIFGELYRATPSDATAEGLALSYNASGQFDALRRDAAADSGPLANYARALQSQRLYYQKRFIEAHALAQSLSSTGNDADQTHTPPTGAARYAPHNLDGIDSASVSAGLQTSNHVGTAGQGKLVTIAPSLRGEWISGTTQYNLRYRHLSLDAGPITGSLGAGNAAFATHPSSGKVTDEELQMDIRDTLSSAWANDLQWQASLGLTGGDAQTVGIDGQLAIGQTSPATTWSAAIGRAPVRDSLLSWRGASDPYSGADQGQVARNTVATRALWQLDPKWTLSGNAEAGLLTGHEVKTNNSAALDLSLSRDLGVGGFDYFSIGPALHYLHYAYNLSGYTLGQGGYYSPQRSLSAGLAMQWLSQEDRRFQWQGNVEVGRNVVHQSASPCFPLGVPASYPIGACTFAGSVDSGIYTHAQVGATWLMAPRWQLGALGDANITPGRDKQFAALVFIRYTFDTRKSVFSRDLPVSTRDFYLKLDDAH